MNLDEMKSQWQADKPGNGIFIGEAELAARVKRSAARFDRRIRIRDWLEIGAALLVSTFFAMLFPDAGWVTRAGIILVIAGCILIVWRLRAARRREARARRDAPVIEVLSAEITKVNAQIELLRGVLWWYIGPLGAGLILMVFGMLGWGLEGILYALGFSVFFAWIYRLNQAAVKRDLLPKRRDLQDTLASLQANGHTETKA